MKLIVGIVATAFVFFVVAQVVFGPRAAVVIAGTVGSLLGGPPGGAVGIVFGLAALLVSGVLHALLEGFGDDASDPVDPSPLHEQQRPVPHVPHTASPSVAREQPTMHWAYVRDPKQERIGDNPRDRISVGSRNRATKPG